VLFRSCALLLAAVGSWALYQSQTASVPPPPPPPPSVEPVDLLALVDLNRDRKEGDWIGNKTLVVGKGKDQSFYLKLPWDPPPEYRLVLRITRLSTPEKSPMSIGLASGERRFSIQLDADTDSMHTGLAVIDGRKFKGRNDTRKGRILNRGVPMELAVTVRQELVQLESNGTVIYEWRGNLSRTSRTPGQPTEPLFVGGRNGSFEFERIVLQPLGEDRGRPLENH